MYTTEIPTTIDAWTVNAITLNGWEDEDGNPVVPPEESALLYHNDTPDDAMAYVRVNGLAYRASMSYHDGEAEEDAVLVDGLPAERGDNQLVRVGAAGQYYVGSCPHGCTLWSVVVGHYPLSMDTVTHKITRMDKETRKVEVVSERKLTVGERRVLASLIAATEAEHAEIHPNAGASIAAARGRIGMAHTA